MKIELRKLLPNESNSYREIRLQCLKNFPMHFISKYQDEKIKEKLFFQPYIEQNDINNFVICAFHNNNLVGISGFNRREKEKTKHSGIIIQVYVVPEYQGQKIGQQIIKSTLNEAFKINGIEQVEIDSVAINVKAEKMYKKIGFEEYGLQKNFMKVGDLYYDHIMMMIFKHQYISS